MWLFVHLILLYALLSVGLMVAFHLVIQLLRALFRFVFGLVAKSLSPDMKYYFWAMILHLSVSSNANNAERTSSMPRWASEAVRAWCLAPSVGNGCNLDEMPRSLLLLRVWLCGAVFFLLHAIVYALVRNVGTVLKIHNGMWMGKFIGWASLVVTSLLLPDQIIFALGMVSFGGAIVYLLLQICVFVDFVHRASHHIIVKIDNGQVSWDYFIKFMAGAALLVVTGESLWMVFGLKGSFHVMVGISHFLVYVAMCGASVLPAVQNAFPCSGLFQPSVIALYCSYNVWGAIQSEPIAEGDSGITGFSAARVVVAFATAVFTCVLHLRTISKLALLSDRGPLFVLDDTNENDIEKASLVGSSLATSDYGASSSNNTKSENWEDLHWDMSVTAGKGNAAFEELISSAAFLQGTLFLGSLYMGMVFTDWVVLGGSHLCVMMGHTWASVIVK
eukprot:Nk52_evm1s1915 gene=Nk52_evmTU1s1915